MKPLDNMVAGTDFGALAGLRAQARENSPEAAKAVAKQFEALFVQTMLQSMRQASLATGAFDSSQTEQFQDLFDKQISMDIADRGDLGFAKTLLQQIAPKQEADSRLSALDKFEPRWWQGTHGEPLETVRQLDLAEKISAAVSNKSDGDDVDSSADVEAAQRSLSSREEFVRALTPHAEAAAKKLGVDPDILLAQAALETGWGKHMIRGHGGDNSYNLFGIKAGSTWTGDTMKVSTLEYKDGVAKREKAPFRAYDSYAHSFNDYVDFLQSRPRYSNALQKAADPAAYIHGLQKAGYATDPNYANKVLNIMNNEIRELRTAQAAGGSDNG
ncbi:MAG: flagellar assembly peptidoglycan hydrolase FlgJ [Gammaproteobacteria bacterium]